MTSRNSTNEHHGPMNPGMQIANENPESVTLMNLTKLVQPSVLRRATALARAALGVDRPRATRRGKKLYARAGMTLIEIMVVVIIIGLMMGGIGFGAFNFLKRAKVKNTEQAVGLVREAVRLYENDHPGQCPTVQQLQSEGFLDRTKSANDAWGHAFSITCDGENISVSSPGPDGRQGTDDDIPNSRAQQQAQAANP